MKNKIKKLSNGDFKVEHRIDDHDGLSKQYPKIMKNPARFGFNGNIPVLMSSMSKQEIKVLGGYILFLLFILFLTSVFTGCESGWSVAGWEI